MRQLLTKLGLWPKMNSAPMQEIDSDPPPESDAPKDVVARATRLRHGRRITEAGWPAEYEWRLPK